MRSPRQKAGGVAVERSEIGLGVQLARQLKHDETVHRRPENLAERFGIAGEKSARTRAERDHFAAWRAVRQMLVLRDLGVWAHYIGDASQPLHVTVHYNGWGDYPNPDGFVAQPGLHAKFESDFVNA